MGTRVVQALLATCDDSVRDIRDRALLLLAWSGGSRRRSELVGLQVSDVRRLDADTWLNALGAPRPTPAASGVRTAARAGKRDCRRIRWRASSNAAGHWPAWTVTEPRKACARVSLLRPCVTACRSEKVMAMPKHRSVSTVMGYFQTGSLMNSRAALLLTNPDSPEDLHD